MSRKETEMAKKKVFTKTEIIRTIQKNMPERTLSEIQEVIELEHEIIRKAVRNGNRVQINGFISATLKTMPARKLKSPIDGKVYDVSETKTASIRVGKRFKEEVNKKGRPVFTNLRKRK